LPELSTQSACPPESVIGIGAAWISAAQPLGCQSVFTDGNMPSSTGNSGNIAAVSKWRMNVIGRRCIAEPGQSHHVQLTEAAPRCRTMLKQRARPTG